MFTQMLNIRDAAQELNNMLNDAIVKAGVFVPVSKNVLQYKNYLVKKEEDDSWTVFLITGKQKTQIANTFLKISAFAICKLHEKKNFRDLAEVENSDKVFQTNYIDARYFRHTYKVSSDSAKKDIALWRYEIVNHKAKAAKSQIDKIFYRLIA